MQFSAQIALILLLFGAAMQPAPIRAQQNLPAPPLAAFPHPAYPTGSGTPLGQQIDTLLADPSVSRAHWGIAVTTLDGAPLYGNDEGKLFRPASNNKIFTTATAMALIGPYKSFQTRIVGKLDPTTGTVTGDLTLLGGGDANFGADDLPYTPHSENADPAPPQPPTLPDLKSLVDQLVAKGVKRIAGDIVGDDTLFPYEPYAESWAQDDQVWGYGAPVSALSIANNQLTLIVTPLKVLPTTGSGVSINATVQLLQNVPYYKLVSNVETVPAGQPAGIQIERLPGSRVIRVYGSIAADAQPDAEELAIADPAEYAAMTLRQILREHGIAVKGRARAKHQPPTDARSYRTQLLAPDPCNDAAVSGGAPCSVDCGVPPARPVKNLLAQYTSAPLAEDVILTNKVSQNLHAELFLHNLGRQSTCGDGSTLAGARLIRANLLHAGLDPDDFLFFDGSGLSDHDLVAPRATAAFLAYAAKQPWFSQWKTSLPDAADDGSLRHRFPDPPLHGHIFAKTGTLGESRALSGYLDAASGRTVIFSVFVDDHTPATSADRITMDKIVTAIAAAE
jgi:D-alanyl-D-alanine carboxypeptidase/D-alanyl-D-alanine-endopeptidase (penicillin-binding protein 4)